MAADPVAAHGPEVTACWQPFERFFDSPKTRRHVRCDSRGLLSDLPRKTAEPITVQKSQPAVNDLSRFRTCLPYDHTDETAQYATSTNAIFRFDPISPC